MNPEIIAHKTFTLAGMAATGENVGDIDIAGLWQRFIALSVGLTHQVQKEKGYELHIHIDDQPARHLTLVGVKVDLVVPFPLEMVAKQVPGVVYARFSH